MIGGEIGRPVSNSTGPGTAMPMPQTGAEPRCDVSRTCANRASTRPRITSGPSATSAGSV